MFGEGTIVNMAIFKFQICLHKENGSILLTIFAKHFSSKNQNYQVLKMSHQYAFKICYFGRRNFSNIHQKNLASKQTALLWDEAQ